MLCLRLSQFVTFCYQGLRFSRAVQCPLFSIVRREVRWRREARQTQTQQLTKEHFPLPCPSACSDSLAWHGYEECDDCCEDRVERTYRRFKEPFMLACCQLLCEVRSPGEDEEGFILLVLGKHSYAAYMKYMILSLCDICLLVQSSFSSCFVLCSFYEHTD